MSTRHLRYNLYLFTFLRECLNFFNELRVQPYSFFSIKICLAVQFGLNVHGIGPKNA